MSALTRRVFVASVAATVSGVSGVGPRARGNGSRPSLAVRTRKDIADLNATSPDVVALKAAVGLMKSGTLPAGGVMAAADGRNWRKQSSIHGEPVSVFTHCQHENWYFLPWHRIMLYHFEEIVRQLSGDENFALPYWDWSRQRTLPATFWGSGNALDCPERAGVLHSGRKPGLVPAMDATTRIPDEDFDRVFSPTFISQLIDLPDFETFGGGEVVAPGQEAFAGALERGPHNRAHTWVGLRPPDANPQRVGDMTQGSSPFDPIFWLHHCNVDRIWTRWAKRHPDGHPSSAAWRGTTFDHFYARDGALVPAADRVSVLKALDTTQLGYQYDPGPVPVAGAGTRLESLGQLSVSGTRADTSFRSFQMRTTASFVETVNRGVEDTTARDRQTIRLVLSGLTVPARLDTYYDVYLNCKRLTKDTPITDASYVGSCTFFHGKAEGHGHGAGGVSFAFSLGRKFAQLYGDKAFGPNEPLEVAVIARQAGGGDAAARPVEILAIPPDRVKIEVLKKAN